VQDGESFFLEKKTTVFRRKKWDQKGATTCGKWTRVETEATERSATESPSGPPPQLPYGLLVGTGRSSGKQEKVGSSPWGKVHRDGITGIAI